MAVGKGGTVAYTRTDYKTKKALKEAVANGDPVRVYQPGGVFGPEIEDGTCYLEGPHYPKPHTWYASCQVKDGVIIKGTVK
jgi:hypothetical protein